MTVLSLNNRSVILILLFIKVAFIASPIMAHNKVVVIPLGDDAPLLTPFEPLAPESPQDSNYIISANTVIDKTTNLLWQRISDGTTRTWDEAWTYCRTLTIDTYDSWRLPSWQELQSIVSFDQYLPAINGVAFPSTTNGRYWSSSTDPYISDNAIVVSFSGGIVLGVAKDSATQVRCVR